MNLGRYGDHALITGAAQGIGLAFARALSDAGLAVTLVDRQREALERVAQELARTGPGKVRSVVADLAEPAAITALVQRAGRAPVDVLVCNAAISPIGQFLSQPIERHRETLEVNCRALLELVHPLAQAMRDRRRGAIVLLSSGSALSGSPRIAHYAATKAYVKTLGEGLWDELRHFGVDVVAALPGLVRTPALAASEPHPDGLRGLPLIDADVVARETLGALGNGPLVFPGTGHRIAMGLTRMMPRRVARWLTARQVRKLYPD